MSRAPVRGSFPREESGAPPPVSRLVLSQAQEQSQMITSANGTPTQTAPLIIDAKAESRFPS